MITLLSLLACGVSGPLDMPNPPPEPPVELATSEADLLHESGVVSDVHAATRSFVVTGSGKRLICHLVADGMLRLKGQPVQVQDLTDGTTLWLDGKRVGDLLLVERASDQEETTKGTAPLVVAPGASAAPAAPAAPVDPAAPAAPTATETPAPVEPPAPTPAPAPPPPPETPPG